MCERERERDKVRERERGRREIEKETQSERGKEGESGDKWRQKYFVQYSSIFEKKYTGECGRS